MKFVIDLIPVVAFFAAYVAWDIYAATATVIVACFVQTFGHRLLLGSFEKTHIITLGLGIVFGGATLVLRDPDFIKLKPTLIYAIFSLAFAGSHFVGDKLMAERILGQVIRLAPSGWLRLNLCWVFFMALLGYANIFVAMHFSEEIWVHFKTFGDVILMLGFVAAQLFFLRDFIHTADEEDVPAPASDVADS